MRVLALALCAAPPAGPAPDLGPYAGTWSLEAYVASGGEAHVWRGRGQGRQVVLRFPKGLCEDPSACKVWELDDETLGQLRRACWLAEAAVEKERSRGAGRARSAFARCLQAVPEDPASVAFEVWEYGGERTLGEALFLSDLDFDAKEALLLQVRDAVAALAAEPEPNKACCCRGDHCTQHWPNDFFTAFSLQACPQGWAASDAEQCGPVVHHDLKFDNVLVDGPAEQLRAVVIDFGGAARCHRGESGAGPTPAWVPFWSEGRELARDSCWAYDTFDVGLMALVLALLPDGPRVRAALCPDPDRCDPSPDRALLPVYELVERLHSVLSARAVENPLELRKALLAVVGFPTPTMPGELPLQLPSLAMVTRLHPLLQECPPKPGGGGVHWSLKCELRVAARNVNRALLGRDPPYHDALDYLTAVPKHVQFLPAALKCGKEDCPPLSWREGVVEESQVVLRFDASAKEPLDAARIRESMLHRRLQEANRACNRLNAATTSAVKEKGRHLSEKDKAELQLTGLQNECCSLRRSALNRAAQVGTVDAVNLVLDELFGATESAERRIELGRADGTGQLPLGAAAEGGNEAAVEYMLQLGVSPLHQGGVTPGLLRQVGVQNVRPVFQAIGPGREQLFAKMLERTQGREALRWDQEDFGRFYADFTAADLSDVQTPRGSTVAMLCADQGPAFVAPLLAALRKGPDGTLQHALRCVGPDGPALRAAKRGDAASLAAILAAGGPDCRDEAGRAATHVATLEAGAAAGLVRVHVPPPGEVRVHA